MYSSCGRLAKYQNLQDYHVLKLSISFQITLLAIGWNKRVWLSPHHQRNITMATAQRIRRNTSVVFVTNCSPENCFWRTICALTQEKNRISVPFVYDRSVLKEILTHIWWCTFDHDNRSWWKTLLAFFRFSHSSSNQKEFPKSRPDWPTDIQRALFTILR